LLAALFPAACASTETRSNEESARFAVVGEGTLAPGRYELVVRGMSCPKCISNVDLQLKRIDGVVDPQVDMKHGVVTITVREGSAPTRAAVGAAIGDAGFTLVEIREAPR
jgi:copper chaperone CopZ